MAVRAKVLDYSVAVGRDGRLSIPGGGSLSADPDWTPDHLLLVALARCSIESLRHFARRAGSELGETSAFASGRVTSRESDGRYAFVEIDLQISATLDPPAADPAALVERAQWGCFVGATLTVKPRYAWTIDGSVVTGAS